MVTKLMDNQPDLIVVTPHFVFDFPCGLPHGYTHHEFAELLAGKHHE